MQNAISGRLGCAVNFDAIAIGVFGFVECLVGGGQQVLQCDDIVWNRAFDHADAQRRLMSRLAIASEKSTAPERLAKFLHDLLRLGDARFAAGR